MLHAFEGPLKQAGKFSQHTAYNACTAINHKEIGRQYGCNHQSMAFHPAMQRLRTAHDPLLQCRVPWMDGQGPDNPEKNIQQRDKEELLCDKYFQLEACMFCRYD